MPKIALNSAEIYYELHGNGKPLVLGHHLGGNLLSWRYQLAEFSENFRVLAYELRGHGRSEVTKSGYEIVQQADDLYRLIRSLELGKVNLIGHSIGGMISIALAVKHPEVLTSLILVDTSSDPVPPERMKDFQDFARVAQKEGMAGYAEYRRKRGLFPRKITENPEKWEYFKSIYVNTPVKGFVESSKILGTFPSHTDRLGVIRVPTLAIAGEEDVPYVPYLKVFEERIPRCTSVKIAGSGHFPTLEAPEEFNRAVLSFLSK